VSQDRVTLDANGSVMTQALYCFASGMASMSGKRVKIVGLSTPYYSSGDIAFLERRYEQFGY